MALPISYPSCDDGLTHICSVFLIVNHYDAGVIGNCITLTLYVTDLPATVSFEVDKQELVSFKDNKSLGHLLSFFNLKSIIFLYHSIHLGTFAIHILFIVFFVIRLLGGGSRFCSNWVLFLFLLGSGGRFLLRCSRLFRLDHFNSVVVNFDSLCCHF